MTFFRVPIKVQDCANKKWGGGICIPTGLPGNADVATLGAMPFLSESATRVFLFYR